MSDTLTADELRTVLHYDPITGMFTWLKSARNAVAGAGAGSWHSSGYKTIWMSGRAYKCHRLAWLYVYGNWPSEEIDHINGVKHDNRIVNLREATRRQNMQNMTKPKSGNKSGFRGVSPSGNRYLARIHSHGIAHYLGTFATPEDAHSAYLKAKATIHV